MVSKYPRGGVSRGTLSLATARSKFVLLGMICAGLCGVWGCEESKPATPGPGSGEFVPGGKTQKKGGGEFVPGKTDKTTPKSDAKREFKGAGTFLVKEGELEGLTFDQGPHYFTKDNLFETLDGGSEGYIAYKMVQMARGSYKGKMDGFDDEVAVDIFKFSEDLGAFGEATDQVMSCDALLFRQRLEHRLNRFLPH